MSKARINILWQQKAICMLIAAMLLSCVAQAQLSLKRQKYDSIAAKWKGEHAVYTDIIDKMEIVENGGGIYATSEITYEKLFISQQSLNKYNSDPVWSFNYTYLNQVDANADDESELVLEAAAYIPEGNDYKRVNNVNAIGKPTSTYSGLTKNTITRTNYKLFHQQIHLLPTFYFSRNIPVMNATLEFTTPKNVSVGFFVKGEDTSNIKREVEEKDGKVIYRFIATNVRADKHYANVPSADYYRPHVVPYVKSYRLTGAKKDSVVGGGLDANQKIQYAYVHGLNLKDDTFLNRKTKELVKYAYSDRDKVQHIYDWVQKYFHYYSQPANDLEGFVPREADSVCMRGYGDCKDMSSVFYAMCRRAGIPAYFVSIGTDDIPYTHEEQQSERVYNHMMCAVKLDGEWVFLDGTMHVMPLGANRDDIQGKEAFIMLDENHYEVVKIPESPASATTVTSNATMNLSYSDVTGTISRNYTGHEAWNLGEALNYMNRKDERDIFIRKKIQSGNDKFLVKDYNINRNEQGQKEISINANYTLGNYAVQTKKDCYVNMNINKTFVDTRINDKDRNVPFYLRYKTNVKETVTLNIPKGYRITYVPKAAKGSLDGQWNYSITYTSDKKANTVTLVKEYSVNTMKINPSQFEAHNKLVDELKRQYKETVVLTAK